MVDTGVVRFDLDHHEHGALRSLVTLLPPHVPHDGRSVDADGFRKRVVYLDEGVLDASRVGAAVDHPGWQDPDLRRQVHGLHESLRHPGDTFEAESRLALVRERLHRHLAGEAPRDDARRDPLLVRRLRELLDERLVDGLTLDEAATLLGAHPTHLVRSFSRELGIPPHRYLVGRRLDRARALLLAGQPPATVAVAVGFHDQAHLHRHFKRLLGIGPGAYATSA